MQELIDAASRPAPLLDLPAFVGPVLLALALVIVVALWWKAGWAWAISAVAGFGILQNILVAVTGLSLARWIDDAGLAALCVLAVIDIVRHRTDRRWLLVPLGIGVIVLVQALRGPDLDSAVLQARQFATPLLLVCIGVFMRHRIDRAQLFRIASIFTLVVSAYMLIEISFQTVIIDPVYTYSLEVGGAGLDGLRYGLPPAYIADITSDLIWFRSGGPFFNPPIAGIFVASGVYAATRMPSGWLKWTTIGLGGIAVVTSIARAGILLVLVVTLGFVVWKYLGRVVSLVVGSVVAIAAAVFFWAQGNTASHAMGFINGLAIAFTRPLGDGLGVHGYFAAEDDVGSNESLIGLIFACFGLLAVIAFIGFFAAIITYLWIHPRIDAAAGIFMVGVLLVAVFSESVASLRGTVFLWVFFGLALADVAGSLIRAARSKSNRPVSSTVDEDSAR